MIPCEEYLLLEIFSDPVEEVRHDIPYAIVGKHSSTASSGKQQFHEIFNDTLNFRHRGNWSEAHETRLSVAVEAVEVGIEMSRVIRISIVHKGNPSPKWSVENNTPTERFAQGEPST